MKDRFTEAYEEIEEKNPYVCDTCTVTYGHQTIGHLPGDILTGDLDATRRNWEAEDILNPDPMPFGD